MFAILGGQLHQVGQAWLLFVVGQVKQCCVSQTLCIKIFFFNMSKYLQKLHLMDSSLYEDSILYILLCLLQTVWQLSPHLTTYTEQKKKSNSVLVFSVKVYLASKILRRYSVNYTSDFFCVKSQIPQVRPASALFILQRGRQMGASFTRWCEFKGLNYKVL